MKSVIFSNGLNGHIFMPIMNFKMKSIITFGYLTNCLAMYLLLIYWKDYIRGKDKIQWIFIPHFFIERLHAGDEV